MRPPRDVLLLLALAGLLLFAGLGRLALTDRDEGANAGSAREMFEQGTWVTPTLDYVPRFAKPAFVYWLMGLAYRVLGMDETAARLPSAVATAALVLVQYAFARWAFDGAVGFRAALLLLLSLETVALGRMALTDATLTLWTTVATYAFMRGHLGAPPRGRWYAVTWVAAALATLAKGPVGILLPLLGVGAYLVLAGRGGPPLRETRPLAGVALFCAIVLPWYGAMFWIHGAEYVARARGETLGRVFRTVTGPGGTALFYVPVVLLGFFPWSAFLPGALVGALRGARTRVRTDRAGAVTVFAAAWIVAGIVAFSLVRSRLPHYVAPLFPAAALLVAGSWPRVVPRLARGLLLALGGLVGVVLIAARAIGSRAVTLLGPAYPAAETATLPTALVVLGLLALGIGATGALKDGGLVFRILTVLTAAVLAVALGAALPAFDRDFVAPAGQLAAIAAHHAAPCDDVVAFGPYRPSLLFYARRPLAFVDVPDRSRLAEYAARPGRLFVLAPRALADRLPPAIASLPALDARGGYLLLASERAPGRCGG